MLRNYVYLGVILCDIRLHLKLSLFENSSGLCFDTTNATTGADLNAYLAVIVVGATCYCLPLTGSTLIVNAFIVGFFIVMGSLLFARAATGGWTGFLF